MKNIFKKRSVQLASKICTVAFGVLFGLMATATVIASENDKEVNKYFGTSGYKQVEVDSDETAAADSEYYKSRYNSIAELQKDARDVAENIEAEGAVLLKNDDVNGEPALPLSEGSKVSLFSISSVDPAYGGKGSAQSGSTANAVTPQAGLMEAGLSVNPELIEFYSSNKAKYARSVRDKINDAPWRDITAASGINDSIRKYGDAAVFIITRVGGEGQDLAYNSTSTDGLDGNYLKLNANEDSVLKGLAALKESGTVKKIIVLFNCTNQIEAEFLDDPAYGIDAALFIGAVGQTGYNAVGDILTGRVNPSGHLSDTFWYRHSDNPVMSNFGSSKYTNYDAFDLPVSGNSVSGKFNSYVVYQEGIYVGYRYVETRYEDVVMKTANAGDFDYSETVAYPFGYGLSYSEFSYSVDMSSVKKSDGKYTITVNVTNDSDVAGKDAVQVYVQKPYTEYDKTNGIEKASVELVGYAKTELIEPHDTKPVTIEVDERDFTSYDANGEKTYILDAGTYYLSVGHDAHDALNNILSAKGYGEGDGMTANGNADLVYSVELKFDASSYSSNENTGNKITNLFDEADINKYSSKGNNSVTYLSRSNWTGTMPDSAASLSMTSGMVADLLAQQNTDCIPADDGEYPVYDDSKGIMLVAMRADDDGDPIPYDSELWDEFMDQLSWDETVSLIISGYHSTAGVTSVSKPETLEDNGPLGLTARYSSNENGLAAKTDDPDKNSYPVYYPCMGILASTFSDEVAERFGDMLGEEALWAGYSGFYGIGLNTHRSPYEGRAYEYYSEDSFLSGATASWEIKGLQSHGCNAYIKHIALNDMESQRQGICVWLNEQTFREIYHTGFEMAVTHGIAMDAMASFTRIGATYAAGCSALLTDYLKTEVGLQGFVVSDMWTLAYVDEQLPVFTYAGLDIPDGTLSASLFDQFRTGHSEMAWKMRESAQRILYATVQSNGMNGYTANTRMIKSMPWWQATCVAVDVALGVLTVLSLAAAATCYVFWLKDEKAGNKV